MEIDAGLCNFCGTLHNCPATGWSFRDKSVLVSVTYQGQQIMNHIFGHVINHVSFVSGYLVPKGINGFIKHSYPPY